LMNPNFFTNGWSWRSLQCSADPNTRPRQTSVSSIFTNVFNPTGNVSVSTIPTPTNGGGGVTPVRAGIIDRSGNVRELTYSTDRSDATLQAGYTNSQSYDGFIQSACAQYGSNIPDCEKTVKAVCAVESGCQPTRNSSAGAVGLMQTLPTTAAGVGLGCDVNNAQCSINTGTAYLNQQFKKFGNAANSFAAYNGGPADQVGKAMGASQDCVGLYAWQCSINPGGLVQTQGYVADVCRLLTLNGSKC
ncbi:MAG: hypothetical protein QG621_634, partial [Patescibacteria group bacterium]|nr:hypothetical protein [Patescibacteria group bacterium]